MNVLFVCSRNQWRSPTAEQIYKDHPSHLVRSAGTAASARIKVSAKLINWADLIFTMEKHHKQRLVEKFPEATSGKSMVVLDIPDDYGFMDPELVSMLKRTVSIYLDEVG